MSKRFPFRSGVLAVLMLAGTGFVQTAYAQTTSAWPAQWPVRVNAPNANGAANGEPAWQSPGQGRQAQSGVNGQAPVPPRLPDQSEPWQRSGGGEAAGRIGVARPDGEGRLQGDGLNARTQASGLAPRSGRDRSQAFDTNGVFVPRGQRRNDASADGLRLRRVIDRTQEDDLVPVFDQDTGADFARSARAPQDDPYAPLGLRAGSFTVTPSIEIRGGHTASDPGEDSDFLRLQPDVAVISDWSRHELRGRVSARHEESSSEPSSDTRFDASLGLRIDINRDTVARFDVAYARDRVNPTDPDLPATALEETSVDEVSLVTALSRRFGRVLATVTGTITDFAYGETRVAGGGAPVDGSEQDYREYAGALRLDYEITGRLGVFGEAGINTRDYATDVSSGGLRLGSDGVSVLAGVTLGGGGKLSGEAGIGYQRQSPDEPSYDPIDALLVRGALIWEATALTTVTLTAESEIDESVSSADGGFAAYSLRAGIAHALRRNVIVTAGIGLDIDDSSNTFSLEAGGEYRLNRMMALLADITHEHASGDGASGDETTVTVGLRLQR